MHIYNDKNITKTVFLCKKLFEDGNLEKDYIFSGKGAMNLYPCSIKQIKRVFGVKNKAFYVRIVILKMPVSS